MLSLSDIAEILKSKDKFYIFTHKYPDGDAIGSAYALCIALQTLGKRARVLIEDKDAKKYDFLEGYIKKEIFEEEFLISVDLADENQLEEHLREKYSGKINLCIDHHLTNSRYAAINFVNSNSASTAEIMYELIDKLDVNIEKKIAECLYVGVSTDTGCFKYSNVTAKTHRIAADLIEKGINLSGINRVLFDTKSKKFLKLEMFIYGALEYYFSDRCAVVTITSDMLKKSGILENELEGVASITRSIEGVEIGITIREKGDNFYKVSVRTAESLNAAKICEEFGGGGHSCAAGFSFYGSLDDLHKKIINCIEKKIKL